MALVREPGVRLEEGHSDQGFRIWRKNSGENTYRKEKSLLLQNKEVKQLSTSSKQIL